MPGGNAGIASHKKNAGIDAGVFCFEAVIPERCAASNPESRDSGSGPSDHPGM